MKLIIYHTHTSTYVQLRAWLLEADSSRRLLTVQPAHSRAPPLSMQHSSLLHSGMPAAALEHASARLPVWARHRRNPSVLELPLYRPRALLLQLRHDLLLRYEVPTTTLERALACVQITYSSAAQGSCKASCERRCSVQTAFAETRRQPSPIVRWATTK